MEIKHIFFSTIKPCSRSGKPEVHPKSDYDILKTITEHEFMGIHLRSQCVFKQGLPEIYELFVQKEVCELAQDLGLHIGKENILDFNEIELVLENYTQQMITSLKEIIIYL